MAGPEAKIQRAVIAYAKSHYKDTLIARKGESGKFGTTGWPDYEFLLSGGRVFFVEFKTPGKEPTPLQWQRIGQLRGLGHRVYICDSIGGGKAIMDVEAGS